MCQPRSIQVKQYFLQKKSYTLKMEIDAIEGNDGHTYRIKKIDEIQEILIEERDKRNELSKK